MVKEDKKKIPSVKEELSKLQRAEALKQAKARALQEFKLRQAPIRTVAEIGLAQRQTQVRQRVFTSGLQRAEELEIWATSLNEIPLLHSMERQRMKITDPTSAILNAESSARRVCSPNVRNQKIQEFLDLQGLPD